MLGGMRPVLWVLPAKAVFVVLVVLTGGVFVVGRWRQGRWRGDALYGVAAAALVAVAFAPGPLLAGRTWLSTWPGLPLHAYGSMLGLSLVVGWFVATRLAGATNRSRGLRLDDIGALYFWSLAGALVGARLLYVLVNPEAFTRWVDVVSMRQGGLVAYGGMLGGLLASVAAARARRVPFFEWADAAAPAVALGTGITRIGCWLYGCDFGRPTSLPWGVRFPPASPAYVQHERAGWLATGAEKSLSVHPTQLYEAVVGFLLFAALMVLRRRRLAAGAIFCAWLAGYGVLRALIEFARGDEERGHWGPVSTSQFIGLACAAFAGVLALALRRREVGGIRTPRSV